MSVRTTRYQGGSIVSFIIITVLIAAVVGVGLHVLRQRSEQSRIGQAASQDVPPELPGSTATDSEKKDATDSETFPSSTKDDADKEKAADTSSTADTGSATNLNGSTSPSSTTPPSVAALPETGPEQLLVIPVLAAVVFVAVAYTNSSRTLARLR